MYTSIINYAIYLFESIEKSGSTLKMRTFDQLKKTSLNLEMGQIRKEKKIMFTMINSDFLLRLFNLDNPQAL